MLEHILWFLSFYNLFNLPSHTIITLYHHSTIIITIIFVLLFADLNKVTILFCFFTR